MLGLSRTCICLFVYLFILLSLNPLLISTYLHGIASKVPDKQMVSWVELLKIISQNIKSRMLAPDVASRLFCRQPGERSRQFSPRLRTQEVRHRCQSSSSQMCLHLGEQGVIISSTTASFLFRFKMAVNLVDLCKARLTSMFHLIHQQLFKKLGRNEFIVE